MQAVLLWLGTSPLEHSWQDPLTEISEGLHDIQAVLFELGIDPKQA